MTIIPSIPKFIREILLVNLFIANIFIASITNYSLNSFILKAISIVLLWIIIIFDYKAINFDFIDYIKSKHFKKFILVLGLFLLIPLISLSYSYNFKFGLQKFISLPISTIPAILAFLYIVLTLNIIRIQVFILSISVVTMISLALIIMMHPFSYHDMNVKNLTNWSHVIYGRFIGCVYIIILFYLLNIKNKKLILLFSFILSVIIIGIYLSGLRAVIIGISIFTIVILLIKLYQQKIYIANFIGLLTSIIVSFLLISFFSPQNNTLTERLENLQDLEGLRFNNDGPIHSRFHFYNICFEIIKEKPLLGVGFGGFRNYKNDELTRTRKYPHNIFLEFAVELGIPGILLLLFLLYIIFSATKKISTEILIFFLFALWLAMFSKDIPSQSILWIGLAFYGTKDFRLPAL